MSEPTYTPQKVRDRDKEQEERVHNHTREIEAYYKHIEDKKRQLYENGFDKDVHDQLLFVQELLSAVINCHRIQISQISGCMDTEEMVFKRVSLLEERVSGKYIWSRVKLTGDLIKWLSGVATSAGIIWYMMADKL